MTIRIRQEIVPGSRGTRGSAWRAVCEYGQDLFSATSRSGAPMKLARQMVEAGVPDQSVEVATDGLRGCHCYPSLLKMAGKTVEESSSTPIRLARYRPPAFGDIGPKHGASPVGKGNDTSQHPDRVHAPLATPRIDAGEIRSPL